MDLKHLRKEKVTELVAARVTPEIKERFEEICQTEGVSVSAALGELMKDFINKYKG